MSQEKAKVWATCRCKARWTGLGRAHCSGCHNTFSSVSLFDQHLTGVGACLSPESMRYRLFDEVWHGKEMSPEVRRQLQSRERGAVGTRTRGKAS